MFYFSFILPMWTVLFFNVLKPWNNSEMLKQFISGFILVLFMLCEPLYTSPYNGIRALGFRRNGSSIPVRNTAGSLALRLPHLSNAKHQYVQCHNFVISDLMASNTRLQLLLLLHEFRQETFCFLILLSIVEVYNLCLTYLVLENTNLNRI